MSEQAPTLTLQLAEVLAVTVKLEAARVGAAIAVTILDHGGDVLLVHRMDGAIPVTAEVSRAKARTARLFNSDTAGLRALRVDLECAIDPPLCTFAGGYPIRNAGRLIGAIGVSGASEEVDDLIARKASDVAEAQSTET